MQESKYKLWDTTKKNSIWDESTHGWLDAPSNGSSGGILTSWDKQYFTYTSHTSTNNWLLFQGTTVHTSTPFICINVYAPQSTMEKYAMWDQLSNTLNSNSDIATIIMGDFSSVRGPNDRLNCAHSNLDFSTFNDFILNNGLIDLPTPPHTTHGLELLGRKANWTGFWSIGDDLT